MKYIIYEIWTRSRIVEADSVEDALIKGEPMPMPNSDLSLSNWHVGGRAEDASRVAIRGKALMKMARAE